MIQKNQMKIKWRFIRHGELPVMNDNEVAVDISSPSGQQELLFDHHSSLEEVSSSASVVFEKKDKLEKLKDKKEVIINCHSNPDTDCALSSFIVVSYLKDLTIPSPDAKTKTIKIIDNKILLRQLLHVGGEIDQGKICPVFFENSALDFNFYSLMLLLNDFIKSQNEKNHWHAIDTYISRYNLDLSWDSWEDQFMAYSFVFFNELVKHDRAGDFLTISKNPVNKTQTIGRLDDFLETETLDWELKPVFFNISRFVKETLTRGRTEVKIMFERGNYDILDVKSTTQFTNSEIHDARILFTRLPSAALPLVKTLRGNWIDPGKNERIDILAFEPEEEYRRVVVSVDPGSDISLKGLGLALDRKTTEKARGRRVKISREWRLVDGKKCPDPLFLYQDPWYDGRGFDYTIVDAPSSRANRFLSINDIKEVLESGWYKLAGEYETDAYKQWLSGDKVEKETIQFKFQEALYTRHFLYPLVSLYPMQIDLHWIMILMDELPSEAEKHFEELAEKRPRWPRFTIQGLTGYIGSYKKKCQAKIKPCDCPFEEDCEDSRTGKYGWCKRYPYAPLTERGESLPSQLEAFPSAYEIMNHQLEWLACLNNKADDELVYLQKVILESLQRLLTVRDEGIKHETTEVSVQDLSMESALIDHRINRFCDYILEEIEEICLAVHDPYPGIQERVDDAQMYIKNGMSLLENLDEKRQKLFAPFLANIVAFLEGLDRVLHRFKAEKNESQDIPEDMLFLLVLSLEKEEDQTWYKVFRSFIREKLKSERIKQVPEMFFQSHYWSYTVLGPRVLGELYIATINHSYKTFDYLKASLYFKRLKNQFIKPLPFGKKSGLLVKGKNGRLRKLTGLKIKLSNLRSCYHNQFRLPFLLNVSFGAGLLVMSEMDYQLWSKHVMESDFPWLVVALLIVSSFTGTVSIVSGKKRFKRAARLFLLLITSALIPSLLSCIIFQDIFQISNPSFLFLLFGSIFFAVVIDTFADSKKV